MQFLGIDYGTRRLGLSVGDELGVATPLPALPAENPETLAAALAALVRARRITEIVVGHPLNMDDTVGPRAKAAEEFAESLRVAFGFPVHLVDERLTSYEAEAATPKARRREQRASGIVDSRAACLILQDYLDTRFPSPLPEAEEEGP